MMAKGGTELLQDELFEELGNNYSSVDIQCGQPKQTDRPIILWQHHSYDQPCLGYMKNLAKGDYGIHHIVFVSYWQAEMYKRIFEFTCPFSVIENSIRSIEPSKDFFQRRHSDTIKVLYASTPFRGLNILCAALYSGKLPENMVISAAGGMGLYAQDETPEYIDLYKSIDNHPKGNWLGTLDNNSIRKHMDDYHILGYPCVWEETSCRTAIEALYHDMIVVTSGIGALPETCKGKALLYALPDSGEEHVEMFINKLKEASSLISDMPDTKRSLFSDYILEVHDIKNTVTKWKDIINKVSSNSRTIT